MKEGMQLLRKTFADTLKQQNQVISNNVPQATQFSNIQNQTTSVEKSVKNNTLDTSNMFNILSSLADHDASEEPREDSSDNLHISIYKNKEKNVAKKTVQDKSKTLENYEDIEALLRELDGPSEFGKRPRTPSEPSSPKEENNSHSPSSKCLKTTSSEETIVFITNSENLSENSSKVDSQYDKKPKKESNLRPYKSLIRDFPMPPNDNKVLKAKFQ